MVRFFFSIILLLGIINLSSCKKEALIYEVEGTVVDVLSGDPIANAEINLYLKKYNQNVLNDNFIFERTITSDENGSYSFSLDRERIYNVKFEVSHPKFYEKDYIYSQDSLRTNTINRFDFSLEALGWLKLVITNPIVTPEEQLNIHKSNFKEDCTDCCSNGGVALFEIGDTNIVCAVTGGSTVKIDYGEATISSTFTKEITCNRFDTTYFTISY